MRPVENKDGTGWHLESVREEAEQMIPASKVRELRNNRDLDPGLTPTGEWCCSGCAQRHYTLVMVRERIDAILREGGA